MLNVPIQTRYMYNICTLTNVINFDVMIFAQYIYYIIYLIYYILYLALGCLTNIIR